MGKRGRREDNANSNDGREADPSFETNKTFVMIIKNRNLSWETIDFSKRLCALLTHPTQAIPQLTTGPPKARISEGRVWGLKKPGRASGPDGTKQLL